MTRTLDTTPQRIQTIAKRSDNFGRTISGSLAEDYDGSGSVVRVRVGKSAGAITALGKITRLTANRAYHPEGSPVSLKIERGKVEVIAFGFSQQLQAVAIYKKESVTQSIANGLSSEDKITFSTSHEVIDTHDVFTDADDSLTIPFDGLYRVFAWLSWAAEKGNRRMWLFKNSSGWRFVDSGASYNGAGTANNAARGQNLSFIDLFDQDDVLQLYAAQDSGAALDVTNATFGLELVR